MWLTDRRTRQARIARNSLNAYATSAATTCIPTRRRSGSADRRQAALSGFVLTQGLPMLPVVGLVVLRRGY